MPAAESELPSVVGNRGEVSRLQFEGTAIFSPDALRSGLIGSAEFLLAAHPEAPFDEFLVALQKLLLRGYLSKGFPDASIGVKFDTAVDSVTAVIAEGPRYLCGGVEIVGARTLPVPAIIRRLTETWPPPETTTTIKPPEGSKSESDAESEKSASDGERRLDVSGAEVKPEDPIWERGDPAPFDEGTRLRLIRKVAAALEDFGLYLAKVDVKIIPDRATKMATLRVEILDEGPPSVIGDIVIAGNARDSRESILGYLGLKRGMAFNHEVISRVNRLLFNSARYLEYKVEPERVSSASPAVRLKLDLNEYAPAPALDQEFSENERALLRFCSWLSEQRSRHEDTIIATNALSIADNFQVIFSEAGAIVTLASREPSAGNALRLDLLMDPGRLELISAGQKSRMHLSLPRAQLQTDMSLLPEIDPASDSEFELSFGAGFSTAHTGNPDAPPSTDAIPLRFDLLVAPAACIRWAHLKDGQETHHGDVLTFASATKGRISINARTGQLLEFVITSGDTSKEFSLRVEDGAFAAARRELDARKAGYPDFSDAGSPVNAMSAFVIQEALTGWPLPPAWLRNAEPALRRQAAAAIERIFKRQVLQPIDVLMFSLFAGKNQRFSVPPDVPGAGPLSVTAALGAISAIVFRVVDALLPRRSWPWTTAREAVFVTNGLGRYTRTELKRIYEFDEVGPIAYLTIAALLKYRNSSDRVPLANRGLERLSAEDFRKDVGLLLQGDSAIVESVKRLAAALRDLSTADVDALAAVLAPETGAFLRDAAALLRERRDDPVEEVLPTAFDAYWDTSLRARVETSLRELAAP